MPSGSGSCLLHGHSGAAAIHPLIACQGGSIIDFRVDVFGFDHGQGGGVFGFGGGEAQGALQRGFAGGFREVFQLRGFGDAVEDCAELGGGEFGLAELGFEGGDAPKVDRTSLTNGPNEVRSESLDGQSQPLFGSFFGQSGGPANFGAR